MEKGHQVSRFKRSQLHFILRDLYESSDSDEDDS